MYNCYMSELTSNREKISFTSLDNALDNLNNRLKNAYDKELEQRKNGKKSLFELPEDINSAPLCDTFDNINFDIEGKGLYVAVSKPIIIKNTQIPKHVFFIDDKGSVIDPTFGQHMLRMGKNPIEERKNMSELFRKGIFVGSVKEAKDLGVGYF